MHNKLTVTALLVGLGLSSAIAATQVDNQSEKSNNKHQSKEQAHKETKSKQATKEDAKKKLAKEVKKAKDAPKTMMLAATPGTLSNPSDYNSKELYRSMIQNAPVSKVDPFTGALIVHIPIVSIPGNDGLNLNVVWSYRSGEDLPYYGNGRVTPGVVDVSSSAEKQQDPIFVDQYGHRHKLYLTGGQSCGEWMCSGGHYESTDHWHAELGVDTSGSNGAIGYVGTVYSPDGTSYEITNAWHNGYSYFSPVLKIVSPHGGEAVNYTYDNQWHLQTITMANYKLTFTYQHTDAGDYISKITNGDGNSWVFNNSTFSVSFLARLFRSNQLNSIGLPDGSKWDFGWNSVSFNVKAPKGVYPKTHYSRPPKDQIHTITYPDGAKSEFSLSSYLLETSGKGGDTPAIPRLATVYVTQQKDSGIGMNSVAWNYDYGLIFPGWPNVDWPSTTGEGIDPYAGSGKVYVTTVMSSHKKAIYRFQGSFYAATSTVDQHIAESYWNNGLILSKDIYQLDGSKQTLLQQNKFDWEPRLVAPGNFYELEADQPELKTHTITRGGVTYTTTYGYDDKGMVNYVTEQSPQGKRTEAISNYEKEYSAGGVNHWLLTPQNEEWKDSSGKAVNQVARTFNSTGELLDQTENGVKTSYTYDAAGNIASITNALGYVTKLQNYVAGMPQLITDAAGHQFKFVINPNGTITSYTDGLGNKTSYEYDSMYRLTKLIPPIGEPITLTWHNFTAPSGQATKTVTRGNFKTTSWFDGFGRTTSTAQYNNGKAINLVKIRYDAYGREMFRSYPEPFDYSPNNLAGFLGTYTTRDALGRITSVTAPLPLTKIGDGLSPYQG